MFLTFQKNQISRAIDYAELEHPSTAISLTNSERFLANDIIMPMQQTVDCSIWPSISTALRALDKMHVLNPFSAPKLTFIGGELSFAGQDGQITAESATGVALPPVQAMWSLLGEVAELSALRSGHSFVAGCKRITRQDLLTHVPPSLHPRLPAESSPQTGETLVLEATRLGGKDEILVPASWCIEDPSDPSADIGRSQG